MARRLYRILIVISIAIWAYLLFTRGEHSNTFLISISFLVFMMFSMGIHGLLAHSVMPKLKEPSLAYPLLMALLWGILLLLFIFFIIPALCPDFFFLDLK